MHQPNQPADVESLRRLLRETEQKLSLLSRQVLEVQEAERRRIARELHDEVGQVLTAAKLTLQAIQRARSRDAVRGLVREGLALLDQGIRQVRSLALDLRPSLLDDLGLVPALRWYLDRQIERARFHAELDDQLGSYRLPADLETAVFRIVQEAVTNVARHARARHIGISLAVRAGTLSLVVRDDGRGFDYPAARARAVQGESFGLLGMEERVALAGGLLRIDTGPGRGTTLEVRLPLERRRDADDVEGVA